MNEIEPVEPASEQTISPQKQAILDVAQTLFAQQGYAGLSIRDLAEHCGLAKATVYHHFRDKEELFLSVLEQENLAVQARILQAAALEQQPQDKLRAVVNTFCQLLSERRLIVMSALQASPALEISLRGYAQKSKRRLLGPLVQIIQQGIDEEIFRPLDAQMSALSLLGMLHAFVTYQLLFGALEFRDDIAEHVLKLFLHGAMRR